MVSDQGAGRWSPKAAALAREIRTRPRESSPPLASLACCGAVLSVHGDEPSLLDPLRTRYDFGPAPAASDACLTLSHRPPLVRVTGPAGETLLDTSEDDKVFFAQCAGGEGIWAGSYAGWLGRDGSLLHALLDQELVRHLAHLIRAPLVLHAALLEHGEARLMLIGPAASGKTTLADTAHQAGWVRRNDDMTPILADGAAASFPRRSLPRSRVELGRTTRVGPGFRGTRIVALERDAARPSVRRLRPEEALETLYRNTVSRKQGAMEAVARLLGDADTLACALPRGDPVGSLQMMTRSLS